MQSIGGRRELLGVDLHRRAAARDPGGDFLAVGVSQLAVCFAGEIDGDDAARLVIVESYGLVEEDRVPEGNLAGEITILVVVAGRRPVGGLGGAPDKGEIVPAWMALVILQGRSSTDP